MARLDINAGDYSKPAIFKAQIQNRIDSGNYDEIRFGTMNQSPKQSNEINIGANTIKISTPMKIWGDGTAAIIGTSGSTIKDRDHMDCGIFSICSPGTVEINGLTLQHIPGINPHYAPGVNNPYYPKDPTDTNEPARDDPAMFCHSSVTVACFVDNSKESTLIVTDCDFLTSATGAISVEAFNGANEDQPPVRHDFIIRRCHIRGVFPEQLPGQEGHPLAGNWLAGNWVGVKLGPMPTAGEEYPAFPVDVRDSYFEVSDCKLDPATFAAVAVWRCVSNTDTEFVISSNDIAQSPNAGALDFGIHFGFPAGDTPMGIALIADNRIKVADYLYFSDRFVSSGICVDRNNTTTDNKTRLVVVGNTINLSHSSLPSDPEEALTSGILYRDLATAVPEDVTVLMDKNKIEGGRTAPPRWGIALLGSAHDFVVNENHLEALQAGVAQIFVDTGAHDGILSGNVLGRLHAMVINGSTKTPEAVIFCEGDKNRFFDNDFNPSLAPGWNNTHTGPGPGYFKLGANSEHNILVDPSLTAGQFWDTVGPTTTNHMFQA